MAASDSVATTGSIRARERPSETPARRARSTADAVRARSGASAPSPRMTGRPATASSTVAVSGPSAVLSARVRAR